MGRLLHIGMITLLGIAFVYCTYFLHKGYKNTIVNGKRLIDEAVNSNTRTDKIGIGENLVYVLELIVAILFAIQIMYRGAKFPSATAIIARTIVLIPIMALFNARKRTGKSFITLFASLLFLIFCTMTYFIIGLPVKAPVLTINNTEMRLGHTTVQELMNDGFNIYTLEEHTYAMDYEDFPASDIFVKYSDTMDISIPKGYHRYATKPIPYIVGVLAKNDIPIATVVFYGSMSKEKPLKDCSIIYFNLWDRFISKIRYSKIAIKLNGVDLLAAIEADTMKETFGKKIFRPNKIETEKHYVISWDSNSHHLFYNAYYATIHVDDNYLMNALEFECQIAREAD